MQAGAAMRQTKGVDLLALASIGVGSASSPRQTGQAGCHCSSPLNPPRSRTAACLRSTTPANQPRSRCGWLLSCFAKANWPRRMNLLKLATRLLPTSPIAHVAVGFDDRDGVPRLGLDDVDEVALVVVVDGDGVPHCGREKGAEGWGGVARKQVCGQCVCGGFWARTVC